MKEHRNRTGRLAAAVLLILTLAGCAAFERNTEPQDAFEEEDDAATYILQYQLRRYEMSQGGQSVFFQEEDGKVLRHAYIRGRARGVNLPRFGQIKRKARYEKKSYSE